MLEDLFQPKWFHGLIVQAGKILHPLNIFIYYFIRTLYICVQGQELDSWFLWVLSSSGYSIILWFCIYSIKLIFFLKYLLLICEIQGKLEIPDLTVWENPNWKKSQPKIPFISFSFFGLMEKCNYQEHWCSCVNSWERIKGVVVGKSGIFLWELMMLQQRNLVYSSSLRRWFKCF